MVWFTTHNPNVSNITYTEKSLALGLSVEQCLELAALFEAALENLLAGVELPHEPQTHRPLRDRQARHP